MTRAGFFIDVVGGCNLRCPSCPNGNCHGVHNPSGFMAPKLLSEIVEKIDREYGPADIHLYNWGEPFMHPQFPEMLRIAGSRGARVFLSTNLNVLRKPDEIVAMNPYSLRISLSGFTQATYDRTHAGGDIERVKSNMRILSQSLRTSKASTRVHVFFHRYKHNLEDADRMRVLASELGFGFHPVWALLMPVEKVLGFAEVDGIGVTPTDEDRVLVDLLALPLADALDAARKLLPKPCPFLHSQVVMDIQGRVQLCCAVFDASRFTIASFLDTPPEALERAKNNHLYCAACMRNGVHLYESFGVSTFDSLAARNIPPYYARRMDYRLDRIKSPYFWRRPNPYAIAFTSYM